MQIAPTRSRIIVRNLHFSVDEPFLRKLIIPFGTVLDVLVPKRDDGKPRGFAFIEFGTRAEGEKAMTELNGVKVRGRELTLSWAVSKKEHEEQLAKLTAQDEDSDEENMEETAPTLAQEQSEEEENVAFDANQDVLNEKSADAGGEKELGDRDDATLLPQSGLLRGTTLFLRNVSFDTTEEDIRKT